MQQGAFSKAMRMYTKALELDAGNAILYSNRSAAHFNTRQFSESLEDAESAILCDSMWWKAYKRKGLALIHMQRYEEAIQALEEGLKIVGKNAEMEKNLEFARACQEQAQNLYILPEPHMMQRLESVPVFIVTDNVGQPFFVTYDDGQQVCTFYFDKEDAVATLDWIKSENPSLGDTARVIHITLHQAFNLAQETQKQYYEETTRAAAEEDRRAALQAEKKGKEVKIGKLEFPKNKPEETAIDVDGDDSDEALEEPADDGKQETDANDDETVPSTPVNEKPADTPSPTASETATTDGPELDTEEKSHAAEEKVDVVIETSVDGKGDASVKKEGIDDDAIIDENAPLSFQFRPELRQVQVAVELLNKNPNPPVRPILRDPPSVRKAKAKAKADAGAKKQDGDSNGSADETNVSDSISGDKASGSDNDEGEGTKDDGKNEEGATIVKVEESSPTEPVAVDGDAVASANGDSGEGDGDADEGSTNKSSGIKKEGSTGSGMNEEGDVDMDEDDDEDDEDVELTVDNFNGIPIFQAKGLTLLQKNKQLIPLFFSKWDLESAWAQLKSSNVMDVPGDCEIEVGTLEDVLRRMSECKTDEFDSVFFVPSRESMKAINVKFPLDELSAPQQGVRRTTVKKAEFSKAKQIAARGGTKEEIREAIREDLEKYVERQKMAEVVSQIEHARRVSGVGGGIGGGSIGGVGLGSSSGTTAAAAAAAVAAGDSGVDGASGKDVGGSSSVSRGGKKTGDAVQA